MRIKILVFLTTITTAVDGFEPGLRVKFDIGPDPSAGKTYFYNVPRSVANATAEGWECIRRPPGPLPMLVMYCPADRVVCCIYDDTGYIAGIQVALSKSEFTDNVFDLEKLGYTSWETTVNGKCKKFWTLQQYFVDDAYLAISAEKRLECRDHSNMLQANAVWFTETNKKLRKVSNQEEDTIREKLFLEQPCIPSMGQHYYYNMSAQIKCTYDQMYPWFVMYTKGKLSGTGFSTYGKLEIPKYSRDWFERVTAEIVKFLLPNVSPCVYELSDDPGPITVHFFFVDKPWDITCPA